MRLYLRATRSKHHFIWCLSQFEYLFNELSLLSFGSTTRYQGSAQFLRQICANESSGIFHHFFYRFIFGIQGLFWKCMFFLELNFTYHSFLRGTHRKSYLCCLLWVFFNIVQQPFILILINCNKIISIVLC